MKSFDKGFIGVGKAMMDHQASKMGKDPYGMRSPNDSHRSKTLQSPSRIGNSGKGVSVDRQHDAFWKEKIDADTI